MRPTDKEHQPRWYVEAVIYQLHVRTFADANGDGIGDFQGLTSRLDYLADLGVTCLWLMPFTESPLRDDGYDVSDYEQVHAAYGTLEDFDAFVAAAHARGIRVIVELVINHTSDAHRWFQTARRAPAGSAARDFYVWSDSTERYPGARVIFSDVETSNWAWDPVAGAYYWHRFFSHQPDLNLDNPNVREAVLSVIRFWLDRGVDGLRLDAVAHLFEREGTNCENLPETHAFLREIRASIDERYDERILLAEVNDSPEGMREYFGDGDECHMAFHFPLLPRLFLAFAQEIAAPIVDVVERTADLPDGCRWALFLRNHDELSLSALQPADRDALRETYAPDAAMRLNNGIRRRLAPLLGNDHERLVLAHALLLSLPGTPVLYYGDELGMRDDVRLPDREGLRTPMEWDAQGDAASLLERVRRLIAVRQASAPMRHGRTDFLEAGNPRVIAFLRCVADEQVLVVANLAGSPQEAVLDLNGVEAAIAIVDLIDDAPVQAVAPGSSLRVALGPHACRWLAVVPQVAEAQDLISAGDTIARAPGAL